MLQYMSEICGYGIYIETEVDLYDSDVPMFPIETQRELVELIYLLRPHTTLDEIDLLKFLMSSQTMTFSEIDYERKLKSVCNLIYRTYEENELPFWVLVLSFMFSELITFIAPNYIFSPPPIYVDLHA